MNVKGSAIRSTMTFMRENFPPEGAEFILGTLEGEDRALLTRPIPLAGWFDAGILVRLMTAMTKGTHEPPLKLYHRLGRQSCDDGLDMMFRIFVRMRSPSFLLKHLPEVWHNYYDAGQMILLGSDKTHAHLRLVDTRLESPALCVRIAGWMERAVELSGGKEPKVRHSTCVHQGQAVCEWMADWA
jgi:hypothetical protein